MKIVVSPDEENLQCDPIDPLGSICIEDDEGNQLVEQDIWLDEWLGAFIRGIDAMISGRNNASMHMDSHRDPLIWQVEEMYTSVSFKSKHFVIRDLPAFNGLLKRAVFDLTEHYRVHSNWLQNSELISAREWAQCS